MAVRWTPDEREAVEAAILRHPAESGRCAAVARVVFEVGRRRDETTRGRQVRPSQALHAWCFFPKHPKVKRWFSHTYVETHQHAVDALTGEDGCEHSRYLETYFEDPELLDVVDIDVATVDPEIENVENDT